MPSTAVDASSIPTSGPPLDPGSDPGHLWATRKGPGLAPGSLGWALSGSWGPAPQPAQCPAGVLRSITTGRSCTPGQPTFADSCPLLTPSLAWTSSANKAASHWPPPSGPGNAAGHQVAHQPGASNSSPVTAHSHWEWQVGPRQPQDMRAAWMVNTGQMGGGMSLGSGG